MYKKYVVVEFLNICILRDNDSLFEEIAPGSWLTVSSTEFFYLLKFITPPFKVEKI